MSLFTRYVIIIKTFLNFFTQYKNEWEESKKSKKLTKVIFIKTKDGIDGIDVNKTLVSEKDHLNTLLGIMIMMTLDHYV